MQVTGESLALDQLHRKRQRTGPIRGVVDQIVDHAQIRMRCLSAIQNLSFEPRAIGGIVCQFRSQSLDRHTVPKLDVNRFVDLPHAAGANLAHDLKTACERHAARQSAGVQRLLAYHLIDDRRASEVELNQRRDLVANRGIFAFIREIFLALRAVQLNSSMKVFLYLL